MELKNYLKTKPQFFIVLGLSLILASCSSTRDFNSNYVITDNELGNDYKNYFNDKAKDYETSFNYDELYFTDLNTYTAKYFSRTTLFGQYQYTGRGNRFNNVTIDNIGLNIYSDFAINNLGRTNWSWTSKQLQSWGWINKGWNTPWNQKNWRSVSNSWNGPIWNYWGWDGEPENSLYDYRGENSWRNTMIFLNPIRKKRHSAYQQVVLNRIKTSPKYASITKRATSDLPRSRPRSKAVKTSNLSLLSKSYISSNNSSTQSNSRSNSTSTVKRSSTNSSSSGSNSLVRKSTKN
ncbi:hypothetical protein [Psychroserpens ponticola]|uniref:Lipoprotein n=1 Tax=Psychroserpens ponticola TaxID=2932268 RepID=A0ABY7RZG9_9FLAO|nr:hypothetical protein [Psychroserpens ponticola]WCO02433.1 hypothetical protein MUN68_002815 [Psychroserpens ponticola]